MSGDVCAFHQACQIKVEEHETRIRALEIRDATQNERIAALCQSIQDLSKKIDDFMDFLKRVLVATGMTGIGFIIWYIQNLPRM